MYKKRGLILVVLVLLVVLSTVVVADTYYDMIRTKSDCDDTSSCSGKKISHVAYCNMNNLKGSCKIDYCNEKGERPTWLTGSGCWISGVGDGDCGYIIAEFGTNIDNNWKKVTEGWSDAYTDGDHTVKGPNTNYYHTPNLNTHWGWVSNEDKDDGFYGDLDAGYWIAKFRKNGNGLLCSKTSGGEGKWRRCDDKTLGQVETHVHNYYSASKLISETKTYECVKNDKGHVWVKGDKDNDGYSKAEGDCLDTTNDDEDYCPEVDLEDDGIKKALDAIPEAKNDNKKKQALSAYRAAVHNKYCKDKDPKYYGCSVCRNPLAPEVCGDGVDNDCNAKTSDTCNDNEQACSGGTYAELAKDDDKFEAVFPEISKANRDKEKEVKIAQSQLTSKKDTTYLFAGTNDGKQKMCCGDEEKDHFTKITKEDNTEWMCLDKNKVGTLKPFDNCRGDWCIIKAGLVPYEIFTLQDKTSQVSWDFLSDSKKFLACNDEANAKIKKSVEDGTYEVAIAKNMNKFYCSKEGNTKSVFAECVNKEVKTIKQRAAGDSFFTLIPSDEGDSYVTIDPTTKSPNKEIAKGYTNYYGENYGFDFFNNDGLNFMVKFSPKLDDLKLPLDLHLSLTGKSSSLYSGNVLGYAKGEISADKWLHVSVPMPDFTDVRKIQIKSSTTDNKIEVKHIYVDSLAKSPVCSGGNPEEANVWLSSPDDYKSSTLNGKQICNAFYATSGDELTGNAWQDGKGENNCCGDDNSEYFANPAKDSACWNSQIVGKEPFGEVEVKVKYDAEEELTKYPVQKFDYEYSYFQKKLVDMNLDASSFVGKTFYVCENNGNKELSTKNGGCKKAEEVDDSSKINSYSDKYYYSKKDKKIYFADLLNVKSGIKNSSVIKLESPKVISSFTVKKEDLSDLDIFVVGDIKGYEHVSSANEPTIAQIYLKNLENDKLSTYGIPNKDYSSKLKKSDLEDEENTIQIIAETSIVKKPTDSEKFVTKPLSFICEDDCLFPLPGKAPYTITPKPSEFDLYFVTKDKEELITAEKTFDKYGNIRVKNIQKKIIYDTKFYGCNLAKDDSKKLIAANSCTIQGGHYCLGEWKNDALTHVGYKPLTKSELDKAKDPKDIKLELQAKEIKSEDRKHFSEALAGVNLLPNPNFELDGNEIIGWEIISNNEVKKITSVKDVADKTYNQIDLKQGEVLRSQRIPVKEGQVYAIGWEGIALINILNSEVYKPSGNNDPLFPRIPSPLGSVGQNKEKTIIRKATSDSITLEFKGILDNFNIFQGNVLKPSIQLAPITKEYSADIATDGKNELRAPLSCCPTNYCWNGYACVNHEADSNAAEFINGKAHRCVKGSWKEKIIQKDWNHDKWGFCDANDQCFVMSSAYDKVDVKNKAATALTGGVPTCISNDEYILDNLCDGGNWTTRTKFLAEELISDGTEYTLACGSYNDILPALDNKEQQIAGGNQGTGFGGNNQGSLCTGFTKLPEDIAKGQYGCTNNFCVLKKGKDVFVGTTLNKNIPTGGTVPTTATELFKVSKCSSGKDDEFVSCTTDKGEAKYNKKLNTIIYKETSGNFFTKAIDGIVDFFKGLFVKNDNNKLISKIDKFREIYIKKTDDKTIRGVIEIDPETGKDTLVIEFTGFQTPICDFIEKKPLKTKFGKAPHECGGDSDKTIVTTNDKDNINALWKELTINLR